MTARMPAARRKPKPLVQQILAMVSTYQALAGEMEAMVDLSHPAVQRALIEASAHLVITSDTTGVIDAEVMRN